MSEELIEELKLTADMIGDDELGEGNSMSLMLMRAVGALRSSPAPAPVAVPEGFALVPVEPTVGMLRPFYECPVDELPLAWSAALAIAKAQNKAAPSAPATVACEAVAAVVCSECNDDGFVFEAGRPASYTLPCPKCTVASEAALTSGPLEDVQGVMAYWCQHFGNGVTLQGHKPKDGDYAEVIPLASASAIKALRAQLAERDEQLAEVTASGDKAWGTLIALADKLGIDPKEARKMPGKPSDVYMEKLAASEARVEGLRVRGEELLDAIDDPPEANCSCHLAPPCGDCVDYGHLREAIRGFKAALSQPSKGD